MAFNWRDFLVLAHDLRKDQRESAQRACIGRAYYYTFNLGLNTAKTGGYNPKLSPLKRAGEHKRLWDWYLSHRNQAFQQLGDIGDTMRGRRVEVDYKLSPSPTLQDVQKQLDEARDFEVLLSQITGKPSPPALP